MRTKFLLDFRFSFPLCSVKTSSGFSVNAFGYMKKEFHQECWEFLWCPKGNMRTLEADEREESGEAITSCQFVQLVIVSKN